MKCLALFLLYSVLSYTVAAIGDGAVVKTNKCNVCMASYPEPDIAAKAVSGWYEPLGQGPIAVAHALQLPCGNKFLMIVSLLSCSVLVHSTANQLLDSWP